MPTRVTSSSDPGEETSTQNGNGGLPEAADETVNVDDCQESPVLGNDMFVSEAREPGEVRNRSPAELGEVIRAKHSDGNEEGKLSSFVPKFGLANAADKQVSAMQSLFSSFLPPSTENQGSAFWSKFIQQTAAAAAAQKASQELIVDNSDGESTTSDRREGETIYDCTIDGCNATFNSKENRDIHSNNVKLHCNMFENNQDLDGKSDMKASQGCLFCDKSFPTEDALSKHIQAVHRGQESLYSEQTYSSQIDSMKSKTPVIA